MSDKIIIINRIKKGGGGHHGGAWKVAFADFMTTMMAFFLVMWLIAMMSSSQKAAIANYMKSGKFQLIPPGIAGGVPRGKIFQKEPSQEVPGSPGVASANVFDLLFRKMMQEQLSDLQKSILISSRDDKFRIELSDSEGHKMFESGSAELTEEAKKALREMAGLVRDFENRVVVEGHTDNEGVSDPNSSNWDLSVERAISARRELKAGGLPDKNIMGVVGFADTRPLVDADPGDPRNRRVSILIYCSKRTESFSDLLMPNMK